MTETVLLLEAAGSRSIHASMLDSRYLSYAAHVRCVVWHSSDIFEFKVPAATRSRFLLAVLERATSQVLHAGSRWLDDTLRN